MRAFVLLVAVASAGLALVGCRCSQEPDQADARSPSGSEGPSKLKGTGEWVVTGRQDPVPEPPPPRPDDIARARGVVPHPTPTTADPAGGSFTLEQATEGLVGEGDLVAQINTDLGVLRCRLFEDKAPRTVANFVGLARGKRPFWDPYRGEWATRPFYDGLSFDQVVPGLMVRGGGPFGDGSGGPGYELEPEVAADLVHDRAGVLTTGGSGEASASQFIVLDGPAPHFNGRHSIFGTCTPASVVYRIARVPQGAGNRPLTDVVIRSVRIGRIDADAQEEGG